MSKTNLIRPLLALCATLSAGCIVTKQPVVKHQKVSIDSGMGQKKEVEATYCVNEDEYTIIGNTMNLGSGIITGFVNCGISGAKRNYTETTNGVPVVWPALNGGYGFIKGATVGAAEGGWEGWNATYQEVREQNKESDKKINEFVNRVIKKSSFIENN